MAATRSRKPFTAVEIFCGAGGTSFGFSRAGFDIRVGLDADDEALHTFAKNHPNAAVLHKLIENADGHEIAHAAGVDRVDALIGGPSCQGYSTIGKRDTSDPRNFLFKHYVRIVSELMPRYIVFENVRGMLLRGHAMIFKNLIKGLHQLGYNIEYGVLNAADFGVPQRRERLFLIGALGEPVSLPEAVRQDPRCSVCSRPDGSKRIRKATDALQLLPCIRCDGTGIEPIGEDDLPPWSTVWDAIGDLPPLGTTGGADGFVPYCTPAQSAYQNLMREGSRGYTLHRAKPLSNYALDIVSQIPEGFGVRSIPEERLPERFRIMRRISNGSLRQDCTTLYHRLARNMPAYTITCYSGNVSSGAFTHPLENRAITVREAARLQSFPDAFFLNPRQVRRHIGNAVPPLLAEEIARHMRAGFKSQPKPDEEKAQA